MYEINDSLTILMRTKKGGEKRCMDQEKGSPCITVETFSLDPALKLDKYKSVA